MTRRVIVTTFLGMILASIVLADGVSFKRRYVELDWGQMHLLTAYPENPSSAPPVVCFAPTPYSGNYYRILMAALARDRIVIAPDYPGLGQSDRIFKYHTHARTRTQRSKLFILLRFRNTRPSRVW